MKSETNQHASSKSTVIDKPQHYPEIDPWKLQEYMESSGDAYVDARRCDAMKYVFRKKEGWLKDLIKARNCIDAAIRRLDGLSCVITELKIGDRVIRACDTDTNYIPFYEITAISELFATIRNPETRSECKEYVSNLIKA